MGEEFEFSFQLNHPLTEEDWAKITDLYRFMKEAARGELIQDLAMSQGAYAGTVIHDLVAYRREEKDDE